MSNTTSNTKQEYTYSLKTVTSSTAPELGLPGASLCGQSMWFQVYPPDKYISLKRLRFHIIIVFQTGVTTPNQVLNKIGITDSSLFDLSDATYTKLVDVNLAADVNRRLELNIELTSLLKQSTNNNYYIYMKFPQSYIADGVHGGNVLLCKADALYTTTGIR